MLWALQVYADWGQARLAWCWVSWAQDFSTASPDRGHGAHRLVPPQQREPNECFDPDSLECLAAIVEEGGFERAVRLSITQSERFPAFTRSAGASGYRDCSQPSAPAHRSRAPLLKHAMQMRLLRADLGHDLQDLASTVSAGGRASPSSMPIASPRRNARAGDRLSARACRWRSLPTIRISRGWLREGPGGAGLRPPR